MSFVTALRVCAFCCAVNLGSAQNMVFGTIIDQNIEVTGRIYEQCNMGDMATRWTEGNKHCYMLFLSPKSWFSAKKACENIGGYLATFTSEDELKAVYSKFKPRFAGNAMTWKGPWIGYTDAAEEGRWQWITGEVSVSGQGTTYSNWYDEKEPDDCCGGEDCAHIAGGNWDSQLGSWNDNKCFFQLPYICEKNF